MVVIPVGVFDHSTKSCLIYRTFLQILDEFQVIDGMHADLALDQTIFYSFNFVQAQDEFHTMVVIPVSVLDRSTKSFLIYWTFLLLFQSRALRCSRLARSINL